MKNCSLYSLAFVFFMIFSCASDTNKKPSTNNKETRKELKDTSRKKEAKVVQEKVDFSSKLKEKVMRLATLEHKYQLQRLDTVLPEKTQLLGGLQRVSKLRDSIHIDLNLFTRELYQIQKAFVKGSKPMQANGNTYPRATVEEYIFKTAEHTNAIFEMLETSKKQGTYWMYISKAPHELFVEENRLYFMSSGGFYMLDIYKNIVEKLKD